MKEYPSIIGPNKAPREHCIAFYKYDGSNLRVEWTKKRGFYKFGSRHVLIDESSALGNAITVFKERYAEALEKTFRDNKLFRDALNITIFGEYFGENSFAGQHEETDKKEVIIFDVNIHKKGLLSPREFIKTFGHLKIPTVVYEGNFNESFIQDVKDGKYPVQEGVVAKGTFSNRRPPHNLWMAKCKTKWWMDKLKQKAIEKPDVFGQVFKENINEQEI